MSKFVKVSIAIVVVVISLVALHALRQLRDTTDDVLRQQVTTSWWDGVAVHTGTCAEMVADAATIPGWDWSTVADTPCVGVTAQG